MNDRVILYGVTTGSAVTFEVHDLAGTLITVLAGNENPPGSGNYYCSLTGSVTAGNYDVLATFDGVYAGKTFVYWDGTNITLESEAAAQAVWDENLTAHSLPGSAGLAQQSIATAVALAQTILKYQANRTKIDPNAYTLTIYDNDGVTPIRVFNLKDFNGLPSLTEVAERD